jgi:hypothetical protein
MWESKLIWPELSFSLFPHSEEKAEESARKTKIPICVFSSRRGKQLLPKTMKHEAAEREEFS